MTRSIREDSTSTALKHLLFSMALPRVSSQILRLTMRYKVRSLSL